MRTRLDRRLGFGLVLALGLTSLASGAEAYTRTCRAAYMINETGVHGNWFRREFAARGYHDLYPDRARSAAYWSIYYCVTEHWDRRTAAHRPRSCTAQSDYGEVVNYPFDSLQRELTPLVCSHFGARGPIRVDVAVHLSGGTGCIGHNNQWSISLARNHPIDCTITPQGTIGPVGTDLPRF